MQRGMEQMEEERKGLVSNKKEVGEIMIKIDQGREQIKDQIRKMQDIDIENQVLSVKKDQLLSIDKMVQLFEILKMYGYLLKVDWWWMGRSGEGWVM